MQATDRLNDLLRQTLVPLAKAARFRKTRLNFHRRLGSVVHVINIQLSQGNTWDEARFYVNIGVSFDELCTLCKQPVNEAPKEYECHWRQRMEQVIDGALPYWTVTATTDLEQMAERLGPAFSNVIENLSEVDSLEQFRRHPWFQIPADPTFKCLAHYAAGDFDAAWGEVQEVAARFSDRRGLSERDLIKRFNLERLKPRLQT
jgi:hypothetical protein